LTNGPQFVRNAQTTDRRAEPTAILEGLVEILSEIADIAAASRNNNHGADKAHVLVMKANS
jgi:hypothetical protein